MSHGLYYYAALAGTATFAACLMAFMLDGARRDDDE
jgi:hypothetical protein